MGRELNMRSTGRGFKSLSQKIHITQNQHTKNQNDIRPENKVGLFWQNKKRMEKQENR